MLMNDSNIPPLLPQPALAGVPTGHATPPPGADPTEQAPIPNVFAAVEAILRQPRRVIFHLRQPGSERLIAAMLVASFVCSLIYGVVVGTFSGGDQLWAAPL